MKAYKVVLVDGERRFSAMHMDLDEDVSVEYKVGELIEPKIKGTRLFVFKKLQDAKKYASCQSCVKNPNLFLTNEIWEVEVSNLLPLKYRLLLENCWYEDELIEFWATWRTKGSSKSANTPTPIGTYTCSSLRMLRKVENESN